MHIILGGTSGLGLELCEQLRARGERVLVLGKFYDEARFGDGLALDLYDETSVAQATQALLDKLGGEPIEKVFWAAGYGWRGDFADQEDARAMAVVNFAGALPMLQALWRRMTTQLNASHLVVLSSTSGVKPRPDEAVYVATKYAQTGLARSLGKEAMRYQTPVKVALFLLGGMRTRFWQGREPKHYEHYNDPVKVAAAVLAALDAQSEAYAETALSRGSLV